MRIDQLSLFADIPQQLPMELCQTLLAKPGLRIERIVSKGHASLPEHWYDQTEDEWVLLLQGQARLEIAGQDLIELQPGDYLFLPAHCKHRVDYTAEHMETLWLAIFFQH